MVVQTFIERKKLSGILEWESSIRDRIDSWLEDGQED